LSPVGLSGAEHTGDKGVPLGPALLAAGAPGPEGIAPSAGRRALTTGSDCCGPRSRMAAPYEPPFPVQRRDELLNLRLHLAHSLAHVENDLDAARFTPGRASGGESLPGARCRYRVEPRVAFGCGRLQKPLPFIQPQGLRMDGRTVRHAESCKQLWIWLWPYQTLATFRRADPRDAAWRACAAARACPRRADRAWMATSTI